MRCLSKTALTVLTILLIFFSVQTVASSRIYHVTSSSQHFPVKRGTGPYINFDDSMLPVTFTTFYAISGRHYFNTSWIETSTDLTVTRWTTDYFDYSTSGGTQTIYEPKAKPNAVYFDEVSRTEGNGWTFSDQKIIVTPSGTNVSICWGPIGGTSSGPSADSAGGMETIGPSGKFNSMLIIVSLTVICPVLLWLGETTKRRR